MLTIGETTDAWELPLDIAQQLKDWLAYPAQGWKLGAPPDEAFLTLTEEDLKAAGFHVLRERKLILAKLKSQPGEHLSKYKCLCKFHRLCMSRGVRTPRSTVYASCK